MIVRQRITTALALIVPLSLLFALAPSWAVAVVVWAVVAVAAWEWERLCPWSSDGMRWLVVGTVCGVTGLALFFGLTSGWSAVLEGMLWLAVGWWVVVLIGLVTYQPGWRQYPLGLWVIRLAVIPTLVPAGLALVWLHSLAPILVFYVVALVATADTAAFFVGRRFGQAKLAPAISPGKSREGLLGALIAVGIFAVGSAWFWALPPMDALVLILLSLVAALVSVAGDLQESVLKREAGAKDSGTVLPGHGGVLDRIDSVTAAAPVFLAGLLWSALPVAGGG